MGIYINPANETKEAFLLREAETVTTLKNYDDVEKEKIQVVLVDNGFFTAAGVVYNQREIQAFTSPDDRRAKQFFLIDRSILSIIALVISIISLVASVIMNNTRYK